MFEVITWIFFFFGPLILYYLLTKGSVSLLLLPPSGRSTRSSFFPHNQSEKQLAFPQSLSHVVPELTKLLEELMTHLHSFPYSKRNWMILKTSPNFLCYHKYRLSLTLMKSQFSLSCFGLLWHQFPSPQTNSRHIQNSAQPHSHG